MSRGHPGPTAWRHATTGTSLTADAIAIDDHVWETSTSDVEVIHRYLLPWPCCDSCGAEAIVTGDCHTNLMNQ